MFLSRLVGCGLMDLTDTHWNLALVLITMLNTYLKTLLKYARVFCWVVLKSNIMQIQAQDATLLNTVWSNPIFFFRFSAPAQLQYLFIQWTVVKFTFAVTFSFFMSFYPGSMVQHNLFIVKNTNHSEMSLKPHCWQCGNLNLLFLDGLMNKFDRRSWADMISAKARGVQGAILGPLMGSRAAKIHKFRQILALKYFGASKQVIIM